MTEAVKALRYRAETWNVSEEMQEQVNSALGVALAKTLDNEMCGESFASTRARARQNLHFTPSPGSLFKTCKINALNAGEQEDQREHKSSCGSSSPFITLRQEWRHQYWRTWQQALWRQHCMSTQGRCTKRISLDPGRILVPAIVKTIRKYRKLRRKRKTSKKKQKRLMKT